MRKFFSIVCARRAPALVVAALMTLAAGHACAQSQPKKPDQLGDKLQDKATALYDSTARSGLRGFDCQVHPDWKQIMASSRHGATVAGDDPKLLLVSAAHLTLHERIADASTLDWQAPAARPLTQDEQALLDRAHRGIENTLLGMLKIMAPLVNGSVAESLGQEQMTVTATAAGYSVQSRNKAFTEEFDRDLLLKRWRSVNEGGTIDLAPTFKPGPLGLELSGFAAQVTPATGQPSSGQSMQVTLEYQTVAARQIPSAITIEVPDVVTMSFKLDGCTVNPAH